MIPGAELVIGGTATGICEITVLLTRLDSQNIIGIRLVTGEAVLAARIVPRLCPCSAGGVNDDVFCKAACEKVSIAIIGAPFIGNPINRTIGIPDQQASFETLTQGGIILIGGQFKMLH